MPEQVQTFWDVVQRWRIDALEFLRTDAPRILVILIVALVLARLLRALTRRLAVFGSRQELPSGMRAQQLRTLASVVNGVGEFVILFLAAMQILQVVRINIGPLLASAGVVGLAIGFGAQTLVRDVINGFFVLMENQYDVGDVVKIANVTGAVERMTLRRTVLRDGDGTLHNVPNSQISVVSNMTRDWSLSTIHVTVSYQENSDRIISLLKEIATGLHSDPKYGRFLVAVPEVPGIERISPGEVDYLILIKTRPGEQYDLIHELRRRIKDSFEKNHVQASPLGAPSQPVAGQAN